MKTKYLVWGLILTVLIGGALAEVTTNALNGIKYVRPSDSSDLISILASCGNTSRCSVIVPAGNYPLTTSLSVGSHTKLHMEKGAWLIPTTDTNVIYLYSDNVHPQREDSAELGDIYVNVSAVSDFTSSIVYINLDYRFSGMNIGLIRARGRTGGNGTVFKMESTLTSDGYFQFASIEHIDAIGFKEVVYHTGTCPGCYANGNHFNTISATDVDYVVRHDGDESFSSNKFDYIFYQDWDGRNTSTHGVIHLNGTTATTRNIFSGMFWDMEPGECVFNFTATERNIAYTGSGACCNNECGSNTVETWTGNYYGIFGRPYKFIGTQSMHSVELQNVTSETALYFNMGVGATIFDGTGGVCFGTDCTFSTTVEQDIDIFDSTPTIRFKDGSGGHDDLDIGVDANNFFIKTTAGQHLFNVSSTETTITSVSSDGTGKAVCIKTDGTLGTCTDAVGVGGTCTCT